MDKMFLPLGNGIGLFDNDKLCVSIIDQNGDKKVGGKMVKPIKKFWLLPIIRGYTFFIRGILLYISVFILQSSLDTRKEEDKNKSYKQAKKLDFASGYIALIASVIIAFLFGFLILGLFPSYLFNKAFEYSTNYYFRSFMIALIRFAIVYIIMVLLRFSSIMNGIYSFNGAGNQFMFGKADTIRSRTYPLNFLNFLINIFIFSLFVVSLVAVNINFIVNFFCNLAIFLFVIPLCYETLRYITYTKYVWLKDIALVTNWLVCMKPNITQEEVLTVAQMEISSYENFETTGKDRISMSALYAEMQTKLRAVEKLEKSDIDWIIATVLRKNRVEIKLVRSVSQKEYREIMRACERRAKGEPLSNIFGFVEFYGLRMDVNKKVLTPRMETEILIEEAIKKIREFELEKVLDLCTGSGAIAIAVAKYTDAKVTAIDISKPALQVAENNAIKNDVKIEFLQCDIFKGLKKSKKYDIIISNPPYIKTSDIEKLDIEVKKYDPRLALDGGNDGLDFYRQITMNARQHLNKKGWLFFEVGQGQAEKVQDMMQENGFEEINIVKDYNKIERIVYGRISK